MFVTRCFLPLAKPMLFLPSKTLPPRIVIVQNPRMLMIAFGTVKWPKYFGHPAVINRLSVRPGYVSDKELVDLISSLVNITLKEGYTKCVINLETHDLNDQTVRVLKRYFEPVPYSRIH